MASTPNYGSMTPAGAATPTHSGGGDQAQAQPGTVTYICGDCHRENAIRTKDAIRCSECGYRIVYKKRTKRYVVFDCR